MISAEDLDRYGVPGASWAVIADGSIAETGVAGVRSAATGDAVSTATRFQACSISKPVAALAMLRLVDRGLLDLDQDVNTVLRSWSVPRNGQWQPVVTPRQLVSHSAGLTTHGFPGYRVGDPLPTPVEVLHGRHRANTQGVRVDLMPGTRFRYSGGGTLVLQVLMEDLTRTPFPDLMRELVLDPLGMTDSAYAQPLPDGVEAATAHDPLGRPVPGRWHVYPELAAAGLWTTPADLCRYALAVQDLVAGRGTLLPAGLAAEMVTPQLPATDRIGGLDHVGLGPFLGGTGPTARFGHSGGNKGFRCHLLAYTQAGHGAAVMTNSDNGLRLVAHAFTAIAKARDWPDFAAVELPEPPGPDELEPCTGTFVLDTGASLTVEHDGRELIVAFDGQEAMPFTPLGDGRFSAQAVDAELRLEAPDLVLVQDDEEIRCRRR